MVDGDVEFYIFDDFLPSYSINSCLENCMDRDRQATIHGVPRVEHNLATKPPPFYQFCWSLPAIIVNFFFIFSILHEIHIFWNCFLINWLHYHYIVSLPLPDIYFVTNSCLSVEKEMATHSSILVWKIPWAEEPGGL